MRIDAHPPLAEPHSDPPAGPHSDPPAGPFTATTARFVRWPGRTALGLGILTPLAAAAGVAAASAGLFELATVAAWTAIAASVLAILGGIVAAIGNWDRGAAITAIVLGVLGNPLVLLYGLDAVKGV